VNATVWSVIGTINGNWDTDSEMTSTDGVNYTVTIPYLNADTYEFKIRANGDWTENYGLNGVPDGQNIPVTVPEDNTGVVITFNKDTKEISYSLVLPVYTVSGDFNGWSDSEAMTKDANGIYFVTIDGIDAGGHEFKIRTNNSWDVNYGLNGLRDGDNIPFTVAGNSSVTFYFDPSTKIASTVYPLAPEPYAAVTEVTATENTVTLYYDNLRNSHERTADIGDFMGDWANLSSTVTTVTFDPSFAAYRPTSTAWWFSGFSNMTAINGIENLCTDEVTDMNAMFMSCTSLPSIDLSHFNTGQVVDMSSLFNECTS
jgi:surface protein